VVKNALEAALYSVAFFFITSVEQAASCTCKYKCLQIGLAEELEDGYHPSKMLVAACNAAWKTGTA